MRFFSYRTIPLFIIVIGVFFSFHFFVFGETGGASSQCYYGGLYYNPGSCSACEISPANTCEFAKVCFKSDCTHEIQSCSVAPNGIACGNDGICYNGVCSLPQSLPDATPPVVYITAPSAGITVSGIITVSAAASDNIGITGVQFKLDGINLGAEGTSSLYSFLWHTTTASNAPHILTAVARDAAGNIKTSSGVTVTVNNILSPPPPPPSVSGTNSGSTETFLQTSGDIQPSVSFSWSPGGTASGTVEVGIFVNDAKYVELYLMREGSLVPFYLGTALLQDTSHWRYVWSSLTTPNGSYFLFVRVSNRFGSYESSKKSIAVFNEVKKETTEATQTNTQEIVNISGDVQAIEKESISTETQLKDEALKTISDFSVRLDNAIKNDPTITANNTVDVEALRRQIRDRAEAIQAAFKKLLDSEIDNLARAIRAGNQINIERIRTHIREALRSALSEINRLIENSGISFDASPIRKEIEQEADRALQEFETLVAKREEIIRERVGLKAFRDTDSDGIADYDEVNIYKTDPNSADTDGDGFNDGAEILGGFDPLNPSQEAIIRYEDPREAGIEQAELLSVRDIAVESTRTDEATGKIDIEKIRFSGKALLNSFVTLYIFSDPVVVTVKTDNSGNWSYVFDKQLADGTHEAYVAVTDNTGQIVAKSRAVPFVKEAQALAFGEDNINALLFPDASPGFFEGNFIYIAIGFLAGVLSIALVLLGRRKKDGSIANQ